MTNRPSLLSAIATAALLLAAPAALAAETVNFTIKASMPSLRDPANKDSFTGRAIESQADGFHLAAREGGVQLRVANVGQPIARHLLRHGDIVQMGRSRFVFETGEEQP